MIDSLLEDIKGQFRYGNMVIKLILFNIFVFFVLLILGALSGGFESLGPTTIRNFFALPGDIGTFLRRPWTLITHMFIHDGFGHIFWNMLILYWFGRIFGDLMGDHRVLPLYILGGLAGAVFYMVFANIFYPYGGIALGASAAVMAIVMACGFIAPTYEFNLMLIGRVKLMYIVAGMFLIDLVMISENSNTGGHIAHIGGAVLGGLYITMLHRSGFDLIDSVTSIFEKKEAPKSKPKRPAKVVSIKSAPKPKGSKKMDTSQATVDRILEKIKISGVSSLTKEEKDVLDRASQE